MTAADISRLAGVTRATVGNWRRRHPDFPAPVGGTDTSPTYDLDAVRAWLSARGQLPEDTPADRLRTALRTHPGDAGLALHLLPVVLAAARLDRSEREALPELRADALLRWVRSAADDGAQDIPGTEDAAYAPEVAGPLRALVAVRRHGRRRGCDGCPGRTAAGRKRTFPPASPSPWSRQVTCFSQRSSAWDARPWPGSSSPGEEGCFLGPHLLLFRPDRRRLGPWFLAGFLAAEQNVNAAATGTSIIRVDPRRLRVPLLPLAEQQRYGAAFRRLHELRTAARRADRAAEEVTRLLGTGPTDGALLPDSHGSA